MIEDTPHPDDENRTEPSAEHITLAHEKADELERAAQKFGLYQQGFRLGYIDKPQGGQAMVIVADFVAGDVAWSDRIQNPDSYAVDKQFRSIQSDLENESFEEYRRQLAAEMGIDDGGDASGQPT